MLIRAYIMVSVTVLNQMELCKKKIHMTRIHSALEEILHYDLCKLAKQFWLLQINDLSIPADPSGCGAAYPLSA